MSRSVREVHAAAGEMLRQVAESRAAMDGLLTLDFQRLADHRATLNSATDKLMEARKLAAEAAHDHHPGAEDLVDQASGILHSERVFINQQKLIASGNYAPL